MSTFNNFPKITRDITYPGIYAIANIQTDKLYIGSSNNLHKRMLRHLRELTNGTHHCKHLQNSFNKYGANSFIFIILEKVNFISDDDKINKIRLFRFEQKYIDLYSNRLYNSIKVAGSFKNYYIQYEDKIKELVASYQHDKVNLFLNYISHEITYDDYELLSEQCYDNMSSEFEKIYSMNVIIETDNDIIETKTNVTHVKMKYLVIMLISIFISIISIWYSEIIATAFSLIGIISSILLLATLNRRDR